MDLADVIIKYIRFYKLLSGAGHEPIKRGTDVSFLEFFQNCYKINL